MIRLDGIYHASHCVRDLPAADEWFERVLGARLQFKDYVESALRDASFWEIGGVLWEVCSPADVPGAADAPLGRFNRRYGDRLHSFSWWVHDMNECVATLLALDVRVIDVTGRPLRTPDDAQPDDAVFTHPADTFGMLEFAGPTCTPHCRIGASSGSTEPSHGLGIEGVGHMIALVVDRDAATRLFSDAMGGRVTNRGRSALVDLGSSSIELRTPTTDLELDWHERCGDGAYSIAFEVADLETAARFLDDQSVGFDHVDATTLRMHPGDAFEVPYEITVGAGA